MPDRFQDEFFAPLELFAVGTDLETGKRYLSFPVSNGLVEYEEYYAIDEAVYDRLANSLIEIRELVKSCKRHERDSDLIIPPGARRGHPLE